MNLVYQAQAAQFFGQQVPMPNNHEITTELLTKQTDIKEFNGSSINNCHHN